MKRYGSPKVVVTDRLRSYGAAMKEIGNAQRQETGRHLNNRAENSHQPFRRRERAMLRFRRMKTLQKFASVHAQIHNHFNQERAPSDANAARPSQCANASAFHHFAKSSAPH
jgi:putative transposase